MPRLPPVTIRVWFMTRVEAVYLDIRQSARDNRLSNDQASAGETRSPAGHARPAHPQRARGGSPPRLGDLEAHPTPLERCPQRRARVPVPGAVPPRGPRV